MAKNNPLMEKEKKFVFGQYFAKRNSVERVLDLLFKYKSYNKEIRILEPSSGTKNFVKGLKDRGVLNKCFDNTPISSFVIIHSM